MLRDCLPNFLVFLDGVGQALEEFKGYFSSIRELESSITTFLALRNAQPTRYVWNAKVEDILNKVQRARSNDHAGMREVNFETVSSCAHAHLESGGFYGALTINRLSKFSWCRSKWLQQFHSHTSNQIIKEKSKDHLE